MPPSLKTDPSVARLAADLKLLKGATNPSEAILEFCRQRVRKIASRFECVTLADLLQATAADLSAIFIEVRSDEEIARVQHDYTRRGEFAFAGLTEQFPDNVYAITFGLHHRQPHEHRFVCVIDCRKNKAARSYFSKWHELAHLLTLTDQMQLKFRRTHAEPAAKDPEEALMDVIAGEMGFFKSIVTAHVSEQISFEAIEQVRLALCPEASRQTALIGLVKAWPQPCLLIDAQLATRKSDRINGGFEFYKPSSHALRAVRVTPNLAAKQSGLMLPSNMRVPESSGIYRAFTDGRASLTNECLSWWESQGKKRPAQAVRVEARRRGDRVEALIAA